MMSSQGGECVGKVVREEVRETEEQSGNSTEPHTPTNIILTYTLNTSTDCHDETLQGAG